MSATTNDNIERIHELVNHLPAEDLDALGSFLERLYAEEDPVERAFLRASLLEPEELSETDKEAIREAKEAIAAGDVFTQEEIEREFLDES